MVPVAGIDYPATFQEFDAWFRTEQMCIDYLFKIRWPDGFVCPKCGTKSDPWPTGRGLLMCSSCGHQATVRAGTIFHRSRMPPKVWYAAMWFVCAQKTGVSALTLQNQFGFGSYETAWAWMHKLRRAMVLPGRDLLGGPGVTVEVDQTFKSCQTRWLGERAITASEIRVLRGAPLQTSLISEWGPDPTQTSHPWLE